MNQDRFHKALQQLVYLPSLKEASRLKQQERLTSSSDEWPKDTQVCRPWDRQDLNRRLRTYKAATWFCKPRKADALTCARHGWINSDTDKLDCELRAQRHVYVPRTSTALQCCGASLTFQLRPGLTLLETQKESERFNSKLQSAHKIGCPWVGNPSDENLASHPPVLPAQVAADFESRLAEFEALSHLPALHADAVTRISSSHRSQLIKLLSAAPSPGISPSHSGGAGATDATLALDTTLRSLSEPNIAEKGSIGFQSRARLLACCGWDVQLMPAPKSAELRRWDLRMREVANAHRAILTCSTCGAKVGLWSFLPIPGSELAGSGAAGRADGSSEPLPIRSDSNAGTIIASLTQSIAGGSLSDGKAPLFGRLAARFGRPDSAPIFRSHSRLLSRPGSQDIGSDALRSTQSGLQGEPAWQTEQASSLAGTVRDLSSAFSDPAPENAESAKLAVPTGGNTTTAAANAGLIIPQTAAVEISPPAQMAALPFLPNALPEGIPTAHTAAAQPSVPEASLSARQAVPDQPVAPVALREVEQVTPQGSPQAIPNDQKLLGSWGGGGGGRSGKVFGSGANVPSFGAKARPPGSEEKRQSIIKLAKAVSEAVKEAEVTALNPPVVLQGLQTATPKPSKNTGLLPSAFQIPEEPRQPSLKPFGSKEHSAPAFGRAAPERPGMHSVNTVERQGAPHPAATHQQGAVHSKQPSISVPLQMTEAAGASASANQQAYLSDAGIQIDGAQKRERPQAPTISEETQSKRARLEQPVPREVATVAGAQQPNSSPLGGELQRTRASRFSPAARLTSFDPFKQHRPFCSWVLCPEDRDTWRCGWKWTMETLAPGQPITIGSRDDKPAQRSTESAARLRQALSRVHKLSNRK